jgi:phospholipid transport system substrate-binding protein
MRRLLVAVLALGFGASAALADTKTAAIFVDKVASDALKIVQQQVPIASKQVQLETLFKSNVDIPFVARFVLGRHWNVATPVQQKAYLSAYEPFLMKHYVGRLLKYSGQSYKVAGTKEDADKGVVVTMELVDPGKPSVFVDYRLRPEQGNRYKVTDIVVEGVSLLNTQRSEFNSVVSSKGIDYLISALQKKVSAAPKA